MHCNKIDEGIFFVIIIIIIIIIIIMEYTTDIDSNCSNSINVIVYLELCQICNANTNTLTRIDFV